MIQATAMRQPVSEMETNERRGAPRYLMVPPISIRVWASDEVYREFSTEATSISGRGIYFIADVPLTPGTKLDLSISFRQENASQASVVAHARARVLRSEATRQEGERRIGVAAEIEYFRL